MAAEGPNGEVGSTQGECPECSARERSFDELARGLAEGKLSRRKALRMLGGVLLGGALASVPGMAWAAKPGPCPKKCGKHCCPDATFVCSGGKCACPAGTTNLGTTCCPNADVCGTSCGCSTGEACCSGTCTPLGTVTNCGSCGNACSGGKTCQAGACACPQGQTDCGGVCRDLATDVLNCGLCGSACAQGASCVGSQCACPSGQELCTSTNACVQGCSATSGEVFNPTTCQCECPTGTTLCNGNCVDLQSDPQNCGQCGNTCATDQSCEGGACLGTCPPPTACRTCYCQDNTTGLTHATCDHTSSCATLTPCSELCPPGTTHVGTAVSCTPNPGQAQFCLDLTPYPNITGFACSETPCTPSGT
jgi:hypothetical protein